MRQLMTFNNEKQSLHHLVLKQFDEIFIEKPEVLKILFDWVLAWNSTGIFSSI